MVQNLWDETDLPVLKDIAIWAGRDQRASFLSLAEIQSNLGWHGLEGRARVGSALHRLNNDALIEIVDVTMGSRYPELVMDITGAGLRKVGAWPSEHSAAEILVGVLIELADRRETEDPEEASKLRQAAATVGRMSIAVVTAYFGGS